MAGWMKIKRRVDGRIVLRDFLGTGATLILASLAILLFLQIHSLAEAARPGGRRNRVLPVQVQEASVSRIGRGVKANGTIYPQSEVKLMSRAEGQVVEVRVREGDQVLKEQVLAVLDSTLHRIQLALAESELAAVRAKLKKLKAGYRPQEIAAAEAGVAQARASLKRSEAELTSAEARYKEAETNANALEAMFKRGVISRQEWVKVTSTAMQARADIAERRARLSEDHARIRAAEEELKLKRLGNRIEDIEAAKAEEQKALQNVRLLWAQLDYYQIRSPISGVVTQRIMEPGDLAVNRAHMFTLVHIQNLRVRVQVSELDLPLLRKDQAAEIKLDAYRDRVFKGKLTQIFPQVDPRSRQVTVEVALKNPDGLLRPGLLARVRFDPLLGRKAINLPVHAVVWEGNLDQKWGYVFVIEQTGGGKRNKAQAATAGKRPKGNDDGIIEKGRGSVATAEATERTKPGASADRKKQKKGPQYLARRRDVRVGEMVDGRMEILEGLQPGEKVIVSATGQLKDGTPIRIVK